LAFGSNTSVVWLDNDGDFVFPVGHTRQGQLSIKFPYVTASCPVTIAPTLTQATVAVTIDRTPGVTESTSWGTASSSGPVGP
jgi:hypothetical protein